MTDEDSIGSQHDVRDRILIVSQTADELGAILALRDYYWEHTATIAEAAIKNVERFFDLLIIDLQQSQLSTEDILTSIEVDGRFSQSGVLVVHPEPEKLRSSPGWLTNSRVQFLASPVQSSALLVKVATQLRLRKLKQDALEVERTISEHNAELRDLTARFSRDLAEAKHIQDSLLPRQLPSIPKTSIAAYCVPFESIGGDLYDILPLEDGRYGFFVCDVTGHGLPAAFIGAMAKMSLSYSMNSDPGELFAKMNWGLSKHMPENRFITAVCVIYDPELGSLLFARAGHPPPLLWRASTGTVERVEAKGLPLGVFDSSVYQSTTTVLESGDRLLLYSDGLSETLNMDNQIWGIDGISAALSQSAAQGSIVDCLSNVLEAQREFADGRQLRDDVTAVALERIDV